MSHVQPDRRHLHHHGRGTAVGATAIGSAITAGQSVSYTLTNGTLTVNGNANTPGVYASFLGIGNAAGSTAYANTLTVQNGATVNIGTSAFPRR